MMLYPNLYSVFSPLISSSQSNQNLLNERVGQVGIFFGAFTHPRPVLNLTGHGSVVYPAEFFSFTYKLFQILLTAVAMTHSPIITVHYGAIYINGLHYATKNILP